MRTPTTAARRPIVEQRAGCELWMHPSHELMTRHGRGSATRFSRGVWRSRARAACRRRRCAATRRSAATPNPGIAGPIAPNRDLLDGVVVATDLGEWVAYETPGHAPSHVCLFQPERRLLISGDHLLGRISLYFEFGYSPNPVGEFLHSLDVVERLGARLCLAGHGRTFTDVQAHITATAALVEEHLQEVCSRRSARGSRRRSRSSR